MSKQQEIHSKGFSIVRDRRGYEGPELDYKKIKIGAKTLEDATLNLGSLKKGKYNYANKGLIYKALGEKNQKLLREISNYFYDTNGIYRQVCDYLSYMYRFDWYIVPEIYDDKTKEEKVLKDFDSALQFLDDSHIQLLSRKISSSVIRNGVYYGYIIPSNDRILIQELPPNYCRSRYDVGVNPAIEFNLKFFDEQFHDMNQRLRVLKLFPDEFAKAYIQFKKNKLKKDITSDEYGWYLLEPENTVKFNLNERDIPPLVAAIPSLLDLDDAQELDRRKQMQQLLKVVIQKLPLDKNGDLIFDVDEARDIHNNAVEMLGGRAVGVDVLTTFADTKVEDMADSNTSATNDDLERVERTVYNTIGVAKNLFNNTGNVTLEKSILQDEASIRGLLLQLHTCFDRIIQKRYGNKKKYLFRFFMLETTQYNYKDLSKMYKEQEQIGKSKMLAQIALGQSQSSIIHTAFFENNILHLSEIMIPPLMSSTMSSADVLNKDNNNNKTGNNNNSSLTSLETKEAGRPEKPDDQKSDKTLQNRESMG